MIDTGVCGVGSSNKDSLWIQLDESARLQVSIPMILEGCEHVTALQPLGAVEECVGASFDE